MLKLNTEELALQNLILKNANKMKDDLKDVDEPAIGDICIIKNCLIKYLVIQDMPSEPLIAGVKIVPLCLPDCNLVATDNYSKAFHIKGVLIDDIKSRYGHFESIKTLFETLESEVSGT